MALVPAKCTQCGGNIEVDNTHEAGICQHCGTPFITEKAINNYNTFVTNNFAGANINVMGANVDNLFILAKNAEEVKDFKEANMYYSKILEIEPTNCKALVGKGVSILYSSNLNNVRSDELIGYVSKAVDYKKNDKNADDVIIFSIESAKALYEAAYNIAKVSQNHYYKYWKLESSAPEYWDRLSKVIDILTYVNSLTENSDIKSQKDGLFLYTESLKTIAFLCTEICEQRQYISGITNPRYPHKRQSKCFRLYQCCM